MRFLRMAALSVCFPASLLLATGETGKRKIAPKPLSPAELSVKALEGSAILLHGGAFNAEEDLDFSLEGFRRGTVGDTWILQFRPGQLHQKKAILERDGVRFFYFVPNHAYVVRMDSATHERLARDTDLVLVPFEAGMKVNSELWPSSNKVVAEVNIYTFPEASIDQVAKALERAVPTAVRTFILRDSRDSVAPYVRFAVPGSARQAFVRSAAEQRDVAWVEPHIEPELTNFNSLGPIQVNGATVPENLAMFNNGITGTGQLVAVADSGNDSDMCFFRTWNGPAAVTDAEITFPPALGETYYPDRKVVAYWVQPGATAYDHGSSSYHGTHTTGTVLGDDDANPSSPDDPGIELLPAGGDGMAPNAQLLFQDVGRGGSAVIFERLFATYRQASDGGARIHSNSWGANTAGVYSGNDQTLDRFLFDDEQMAFFFAAGNAGAQPQTTGSPSNAKNVVTVGALGNGDSTVVASFSGRGPTADGRIKPDIQAPGVSIRSALGNEVHGDGNCGRGNLQGTSMSTPAVAGGSTLLRQYFADGFYPSGGRNTADQLNPNAPLVKAVLLNGTRPLPDGGTFGNGDYGWGRIWLDNNLFFAGDSRNVRVWNVANADGLQTGASRTHTVSVGAAEELRVTLVWSDPEAFLGAGLTLVNNLNLTVSNGATTYRGNVFDSSGESVAGGLPDLRNTVEQVRLSAPAAGTYTITVSAPTVPGNGRQRTNRQGYALVVSRATCASGVKEPPTGLTLASHPVMGVNLSWTNAPGSGVTQVYRATGTCASAAPGDFQYVASSATAAVTDSRAQGGFSYAYKLRGADDCGEGPVSVCADIISEGRCDLVPTFGGLSSAAADGFFCRVVLQWAEGASNCPAGPGVWYNIYRSTQPGFLPAAANRIASVMGVTSYSDESVATHTTYYYIVRAEDTTTGAPGPHGGNEEANRKVFSATALGPPGAQGTWTDNGGDTLAQLSLEFPWQVTQSDAQAGTRSYHSGPDVGNYPARTCGRMTTPPLSLASSAMLSYWARYKLEWEWDGVIVEISNDGGMTWAELPPAAGWPGTLAQTQDPPVNACQYPRTQGAFTGPAAGGLTPWTEYTSDLSAYGGQTVQVRWSFTSDPADEYRGYFLDTISITNVNLPDPCIPPGGGLRSGHLGADTK